MPELPEVENLKLSLETSLINKVITKVEIRKARLRYDIDLELNDKLSGNKVLKLDRIGKYLIIKTDSQYAIIVHLGMSGRFFVRAPLLTPAIHDHVIFILDNGKQLIFNDARRFGMIFLCPFQDLGKQKFLRNLGVEPLTGLFNANYLLLKCSNKNVSIKTILMNNKIVLGIGNIYANESLFLAGIHPQSSGNKISKEEASNLVTAIKTILQMAIDLGGTTLKDFVNGNNIPGYFSQKLEIYGKVGQHCSKCHSIIRKIMQSGRSSFYCPNCQQL